MASLCVEAASLTEEFDSINSDGYRVAVELDQKIIGKTAKDAKNSREPRWNDEIQLTQRDLCRGRCLTLTVYISRKFRFNTICGTVHVDLRHVLDAGGMQVRLTKKHEMTGVLNIKCSRLSSL